MIEERAEVLERLWERDRGEPKPAQLANPARSLVPFAHIEGTGAFLYWFSHEGQDPADWPVMADAGGTGMGALPRLLRAVRQGGPDR